MTRDKEQVCLAGVKCKLELEVGMVESLGTLKAITRFSLIWRQLALALIWRQYTHFHHNEFRCYRIVGVVLEEHYSCRFEYYILESDETNIPE